MKNCTKCGERKPLEDFPKDSHNSDGRKAKCKACTALYNKARRAAGGDFLRRECQANIRRKEGGDFTISKEDWRTHISTTECKICGRDLPIGTHPDKQFDHKHGTNTYRGTLCVNCNNLLGHAKDDTDILRKAIHYLEVS